MLADDAVNVPPSGPCVRAKQLTYSALAGVPFVATVDNSKLDSKLTQSWVLPATVNHREKRHVKFRFAIRGKKNELA